MAMRNKGVWLIILCVPILAGTCHDGAKGSAPLIHKNRNSLAQAIAKNGADCANKHSNTTIRPRRLTAKDLLRMNSLCDDSLKAFLHRHGYQRTYVPQLGKNTTCWTLDCAVNYEFDQEWSEDVPWSITAENCGAQAGCVEVITKSSVLSRISILTFSAQGLAEWKSQLTAMGYKLHFKESGERYAGEYWTTDKDEGCFWLDTGFTYHRLTYQHTAL